MKIRINKLKEQLLRGQNSYGIWNGIPHAYAAEIAAGSGFDWICIDGEHAPFELSTIIQNLIAIQSQNVSAVVRIPSDEAYMVKQIIDAGAQTILCPMIESASQAERMAKSLRYPLEGTRGVGTALARAAQWNRVNNYYQEANDQMCFIGQIESAKGVEALDEILKVEGLDVVFFGPSDLAASMGYLGQPGHPKVVAAVKESIKKTIAAGKIAGFLTGSKTLANEYAEEGSKMIGVGVDTILLAKAASALAKEFKQDLNDQSNTIY